MSRYPIASIGTLILLSIAAVAVSVVCWQQFADFTLVQRIAMLVFGPLFFSVAFRRVLQSIQFGLREGPRGDDVGRA